MTSSVPTTPESVRKQAAEAAALRRKRARNVTTRWRRRTLLGLYLVFVMLPIYWLLNLSFQTNSEILGSFSFWPQNFTVANYARIFTDANWYMGYVNSLAYVLMNMLISISVALPAAYAFSRFQGRRERSLTLAVDQRNTPALEVYRAEGLRPAVQRAALIRSLRRPS